METHDIDRIRSATFREARRGYDKREVEQFLASVAEWLELGAQDEAHSYAVKRKLERAGDTTARILATAEEESAKMISEAEDEAAKKRAEAAAAARETTENARAKARRTVEEGDQRREAIETIIKDLVARRDSVLDDIEKLGGELAASIKKHRPAAGADPFSKPSVLDPLERDQATPAAKQPAKAAATARPGGTS